MRRTFARGVFWVSTLALIACVTRGDLEEIQQQQVEILARLDTLQKNLPTPTPRPQPLPGPDPAKVYAVPVGDAFTRGSPDAWVTIVEIADFECLFCRRVQDTLALVQQTFGDNVRWVFKHNPLPYHQRALAAALAAECAGEQGQFWLMHDKLFEQQDALEDGDLVRYAQQLGLDKMSWSKCYQSRRWRGRIAEHQRLAEQFGARGTPAFFINGRFLSGAQPLSEFKTVIEAELAKAQASGIPQHEYYATAIEGHGAQSM